MAEKKYGRYILKHPVVQLPHPKEEGKFWPSISIEGERDYNSDFSLVLLPVTEPILMEDSAHSHDFDMYLTLVGFDPNGLEDLGAEIEMYFGEEQEQHIINTPSSIYIPKGLVHCPLNFRRVNKPILLVHATLASSYSK